MLKCFVCDNNFEAPQLLFEHIKQSHKKKGRYQCTEAICNGMVFSDFSTFKKHVLRCFGKRQTNEDMNNDEHIIPAELFSYAISQEGLKFQTSLNKAALEFVSSLCANMNSSRKEVFLIINKLKQIYLAKIVAGIYNHTHFFYILKQR